MTFPSRPSMFHVKQRRCRRGVMASGDGPRSCAEHLGKAARRQCEPLPPWATLGEQRKRRIAAKSSSCGLGRAAFGPWDPLSS